MKVSELIEELKKFDGELPVTVSAYESGAGEVEGVIQTTANLKRDESQWYFGKYMRLGELPEYPIVYLVSKHDKL